MNCKSFILASILVMAFFASIAFIAVFYDDSRYVAMSDRHCKNQTNGRPIPPDEGDTPFKPP